MLREIDDMQIVILCGGKGERLKPLTESLPKPLVEIKGHPILYYLVSYFERFGFRKFIITTGYKSDKIEDYFSRLGLLEVLDFLLGLGLVELG